MAKAQDKFAQLRDWISESQSVLGLDHWEITVVEAASDVDAWADIEAHGQSTLADLRVSFDFWKQSPDKQRLILSHELMHLVVSRYARVTENLEDALGALAWAVIEPQLEDAEERAVEQMARIVAPYLTLPNFKA